MKFQMRALAACLVLAVSAADAFELYVVDAVSGDALAGATVTVGDRVGEIDTTGKIEIDDAYEGPILVRAPGYRALRAEGSPLERGGTVRLEPFAAKAVYLSMYGVAYKPIREAALRLVDESSLNALVIDIKSDEGLLGYPSAIPLAAVIGARRVTTTPDLAALVAQLHSSGIYLIARIVVFKDTPLATARPELAVRLEDGEPYRDREGAGWTNPLRQEVRDYNVAVAVEAAQAGFDEIQFDYVRFPDNPHVRFGQSASQSDRIAAIGTLLADARRALAPFNVFLSADIFGYVCWNLDDTGLGQRLEELLPLVDYLSPMLYPSAFQDGIPGYPNPVANMHEIVRLSLAKAIARTGASPRRFRPWLQAFRDYAFDGRQFGPAEIAAQVRAADAVKVESWLLWNPRNAYPDAQDLSGLP